MLEVPTPETGVEQQSTAIRKTFLIADVRGYTRFTRERGDEAAAILAKRFADLARDAVEARSGLVIELRGDEALAVFDDPAQAVRAAIEFQATCEEESQADPSFPLPVGIGIDTGDAVPVEDGYRGVALNMAARLCSDAGAGQVLVTRAIVHDGASLDGEVRFIERGPASFKGFEEAVDVIEAVSPESRRLVEAGLSASLSLPPELDRLTPLVDREHELRWLRGTWRQVRRGRGRVLVVSGQAMIGKTRLAAELAEHVQLDGGSVRYAGPGGAGAALALASLRESLAEPTPSLVVLDDLDVIGATAASALLSSFDDVQRAPLLVVALLRDPAAGMEVASVVTRADERGDGHRALAPLDHDGVRDIIRLYVGEDASEVPVEAMARASAGVPGRVHEVVSDWARAEASRRLEAAAEFLAAGRDRHARDLEFANNVIGLKLGRLYTVEGRDTAVGTACPFKGLASFDETDSAYFFGRERLVGELAARTVQAGLLGVVGASGSGKSSVIAAGLLPSLQAGLLPGSERWRTVSMRPGTRPMDELRSALSIDEVEDSLVAAVAQVRDGGRLVLSVDQFEETFTTCESEDERDAFIRSVTDAATRHADRLVVVLAIRGDYYAHCAPYPELAELLAANHVLIGPMSREELRRAIELPGRRSGIRIESDLVDALVEEVAEEPGGLPLLSTSLVELWQAREGGWIRAEAYERTGGVRGAVARLAESSYEQLSDAQKDAAHRIFLRLVATGEGETLTRRRVELDELDLERDPVAAAVLTRLTQDRLLTMSDATVEVAHEALLREWPRLQSWLEDDAQGRQLRQHFTQASRQWSAGGREDSELYRGVRLSTTLDWSADHSTELNETEREFLAASRQASGREADRQRRTNRRLRGLLVGTAVFLVVALVAGALALAQRGSARKSAKHAEASAVSAEAQRLGAQSLVTKTPELSLLLARQAVALHDSPQTESTLLAALLRWQGALRVVHPNENRLLRLAVSPKNDWVAFSDNTNSVFIDDATTLRTQHVIPTFADELVASRDGRTLYVASPPVHSGGPEIVRAVDVASGATTWTARAGSGESGFALSPDGRTLAEASDPMKDTAFGPQPSGRPATLTLLNAADGTRARPPISLGAHRHAVFVGNARVAVPAGASIDFIDLHTGRVVRTIGGAPDAFYAVSPDGSTLALTLPDGNVRVLDLRTGRRTTLTPPSPVTNTELSFTPDGRTLAAAGSNGALVTWDIASGVARTWHGQTGNVLGIGFASDSRTMWTDGLDGTAVEWDLADDRGLRRPFDAASPPGGDFFLPFVSFTPDESTIAVKGSDARVRFLDASTLRQVGALPKGSFQCCMPPAFDRRGDLMVTSNKAGIDLWNPHDGSLTRHLFTSQAKPPSNHPAAVDAYAITGDGSTVAANVNDRVLLLDAKNGTVLRRLDAGAFVGVLTFDPRGDLLAAGTDQGDVVWDARTGKQLWKASLPQSSLNSFSSDGSLYAIGTYDGTVQVFHARTGRPVVRPFAGAAGFVWSVSFNPRTGILASTGTDGVVTLTDPRTGLEFGSPLVGADENWSTGTWNPSGTRYVEVDVEAKGSMWDMSVRDWEDRACQTAGRTLSRAEWKQYLPDRPYRPACASS
jgi:WD40 repeat protein/class 3 adenylate cyclase